MNSAHLTLSQDEIALLEQVLRHAAQTPIAGLVRLQQALLKIRPDLPFHFAALEIRAVDEAFQHVVASGVLPGGLDAAATERFSHLKAMFVAAAAD